MDSKVQSDQILIECDTGKHAWNKHLRLDDAVRLILQMSLQLRNTSTARSAWHLYDILLVSHLVNVPQLVCARSPGVDVDNQ